MTRKARKHDAEVKGAGHTRSHLREIPRTGESRQSRFRGWRERKSEEGLPVGLEFIFGVTGVLGNLIVRTVVKYCEYTK